MGGSMEEKERQDTSEQTKKSKFREIGGTGEVVITVLALAMAFSIFTPDKGAPIHP